ncbi:hypothetical protein GPECTOR_22g964 [Gonium pectorale]|uniref:Sugar phosphate transporter domain-containing protein n=1 Tax=Gonium pectorale TaxID=33097 RepID=A0A150GIX7_GONPE|nr:hypothetical protein GPECTOR_22g964 [Gonium pectorale]|eukprot:KXZ49370.1 hypothetical protein GPECTOR_22g964 [Gonium pectorale]
MVLLNKHALASFNFTAPNALLLFQCTLAVVLVKLCDALGLLARPLQPLKKEIVILWFPCNIIFVLMLGTGFYAMQTIGIGMFTIFKQLANISTALGDVLVFGRSYPWPVWGCLGLMIASAAAGASTDAAFSPVGYAWQLANCLLTG